MKEKIAISRPPSTEGSIPLYSEAKRPKFSRKTETNSSWPSASLPKDTDSKRMENLRNQEKIPKTAYRRKKAAAGKNVYLRRTNMT